MGDHLVHVEVTAEDIAICTLHGYLNDYELNPIAQALFAIGFESVEVNYCERPGVIRLVRWPTDDELELPSDDKPEDTNDKLLDAWLEWSDAHAIYWSMPKELEEEDQARIDGAPWAPFSFDMMIPEEVARHLKPHPREVLNAKRAN